MIKSENQIENATIEDAHTDIDDDLEVLKRPIENANDNLQDTDTAAMST